MDNNNPDPWERLRPATDPSNADPAGATTGPTPDGPHRIPQSAPEDSPTTPPLFPYAVPPEPDSPPPPSARPWRAWVFGGAAGAALLAGAFWVAGIFDDPQITTDASGRPVQVTEIREIVVPADGSASATAVARKVVPSIVTVDVGTESATGTFDRFGSGSGVVLRDDGHIVTNHHVVTGAELVQVIFEDGRVYEAEIVGSDPRTDLAVLHISATNLLPIEIGSTESAEIGETAIAVGSPLGLEGGPSLTVGVISAFGRQVRTGPGDNEILFDMLQTDAPITRGSSGGALVDREGRLLGITAAIGVSSAGAEGVGFAIPIELVTRITDEIIATGSVSHAFLGVSLRNAFEADPDGAQVPAGAEILDFALDPSAAETAGLEPGDVIVGYNGNTVLVRDDLISGLRRLRVGDTVTLDVVRGGERLEVEVVLGTRPDDL
ncbi:MAG: trypsin-like peptidase domain-containing protein [Acidimicrobiia bacterium]|nr:trypsin-like peptidase domain-containing protein [Acidimicrobiia bacterium]